MEEAIKKAIEAEQRRELRALSVEQFCSRFGISRSLAYEEMGGGHLRYALVGKRRLIPSPIDQNRCAQSRNPMDMMRHG
jgi:hypothetical protein